MKYLTKGKLLRTLRSLGMNVNLWLKLRFFFSIARYINIHENVDPPIKHPKEVKRKQNIRDQKVLANFSKSTIAWHKYA